MKGDEKGEGAFPCFVHEEMFLLGSDDVTPRQFMTRYLQLCQAPWAKKRHLLEQAIEELIQQWDPQQQPPPKIVLAVAATLGHFRKQSTAHGPFGFYGDDDFHPQGTQLEKEKDKEHPHSLIVCKWIVRHCPARADVQEEEERERERDQERGGPRDRGLSHHHFQRYAQQGVLQAAEILYCGEKNFEWLGVLRFLPEHMSPPAVNASISWTATE